MHDLKLTIIGSGNMAEAILHSVSKTYTVEVVARDQKRLETLLQPFGTNVSYQVLGETYDISDKNIILCVKPYALADVSKHFSGQANALLSVLAGVRLEDLKRHIAAKHTVRTMPNLAAKYSKSMTTLCGDSTFKNEAMEICNCFGESLWLCHEKEIDIATAVAGSGPAFLALVAESLADGCVKEGLKRSDAQDLVKGLFAGFAPLIAQNHPAMLKDAVMSPGGTTAAGYGALEEENVRNGFIKAIQKAYEKAKKLGG